MATTEAKTGPDGDGMGLASRDPLREITRIVAEEQAKHPVPGVAIGIVAGDEQVTGAFGVTSVNDPVPVDADTLFQVGSITKTFLGTLVMRLVDDGRLELDLPVKKWLPDLHLRDADATARVTLRHCLTHTCGWFGDHFEDFGNNDDALERYVASMAELEQQVPVGTEWAYNNAAFCLAGRVVEVVAGMPIERAMKEYVFVPLGLEHTFFFAHEVVTRRFAVGHNVFGDEPRVARPWAIPRAQNAAGGIVSSVGDLLRYAAFHMGDGTIAGGYRFLTGASIETMRSPLVAAALGIHRGIAWSVEEQAGTHIVGHGGATIGQQALFWIAPAKRFALAMLTNSNQATQLQNAVTAWSWERWLRILKTPPQPVPHTPQQAAAVAGTYRNPAADHEIVKRGRTLILHQHPHGSLRKVMEEPPPEPEPVELAFTRPDRLLLLGGPLKDAQIEILGRRGDAEWIRFQGRLFRKVA